MVYKVICQNKQESVFKLNELLSVNVKVDISLSCIFNTLLLIPYCTSLAKQASIFATFAFVYVLF